MENIMRKYEKTEKPEKRKPLGVRVKRIVSLLRIKLGVTISECPDDLFLKITRDSGAYRTVAFSVAMSDLGRTMRRNAKEDAKRLSSALARLSDLAS